MARQHPRDYRDCSGRVVVSLPSRCFFIYTHRCRLNTHTNTDLSERGSNDTGGLATVAEGGESGRVLGQDSGFLYRPEKNVPVPVGGMRPHSCDSRAEVAANPVYTSRVRTRYFHLRRQHLIKSKFPQIF